MRQYGSIFTAIAFANPVTTYAPTIDFVTSTTSPSVVTGTVGNVALGVGETFKVTLNGVDYSTTLTPSNFTITGNTWTLTPLTTLTSGIYEVKAVRTTSGGLAIPDQSASEIVINDSPYLNDTPLSITVTEDAGVPVGAVGELLSTFTGGISDINGGPVGNKVLRLLALMKQMEHGITPLMVARLGKH